MVSGRRNFLAGVASSGWTALAGLLVVPWYIRYLGIEAYGLIGVHLTLQSIFALLDLGLSPAVSREIARARVSDTMARAHSIVHSMSILFFVSGLMMAAILAGLAPWLARNWLSAGNLPIGEVVMALALSAVAIGARWPGTLYLGVLNGAQRIDWASAITIATTTLASVGAVFVLAFIEPTLRAFFIWQAIVGALHSILMRMAAHRAIGSPGSGRFNLDAMRSIWRFSAGMAGVAATGILFSQIDKLVLMHTVTLDQVGHYTVATALAGALYRLVTPAFNVVYPQFCALVEAGSAVNLAQRYHQSTRAFLTVIFPVAMLLTVCAQPILSLWIRDPRIVEQTYPLVILLSLGTAIHCTMYFPYALQIASGNTRAPLFINIALSVIFLPAVFLLSARLGAEGAAIAWVLLHTLYFLLGSYVTDRFILPGEGLVWIVRGVAPPLAISAAFGFGAALAISPVESALARIVIGGGFAVAALLAGGLMLPEGRALLTRVTRTAIRD